METLNKKGLVISSKIVFLLEALFPIIGIVLYVISENNNWVITFLPYFLLFFLPLSITGIILGISLKIRNSDQIMARGSFQVWTKNGFFYSLANNLLMFSILLLILFSIIFFYLYS